MYYTVYKIINKINGHIYVGVHATENLNDSYMGSGKLLIEDMNKLGKENFSKEILYIFDNPEEMFLTEKKIVNKDFVERTDTYNIILGGKGGSYWQGRKRPDQSDKMSGIGNPMYGKYHSQEVKDKISKANFGRKFSDEVNKKKANSKEKNVFSKPGMVSVFDLENKKKIRVTKEEFEINKNTKYVGIASKIAREILNANRDQ